MSDALAKAVYEALLPEGSIWTPKPDGGLDELLEGMGTADENVIDFLASLASLRDPATTTILSDLEKEYGIVPAATLTEAERRQALSTIVYQDRSTGSAQELQTVLQSNGFDVQVHENSPAVDPDLFLNAFFLMYADGPNAFAGFIPLAGPPSTAVAGKTGGILLVNGFSGTQRADYLSYAGNPNMVAFNAVAVAGRFDQLVIDQLFYPVSDDPDTWPLYFFVGGDATRDGSGALANIETADVPNNRRSEFERLILRYKPIHTWAGLIINFT